MKKILFFLMVVIFNYSALSTIIAFPPKLSPKILNQSLATSFQEDKIFLEISPVIQVKNYYDVPASLMSIFTFCGWEKDKTQTQIYQEVRALKKTAMAISRISVDDVLATYINEFLYKNTGQESGYNFNYLDSKFGFSLADVSVFSTYVWSSLTCKKPILMEFKLEPGLGHAVVLCGYKENLDNHWDDDYVFMDPLNGKFFDVLAKDIRRAFKCGINVIGYGNMLPITTHVEVKIDPFLKDVKNIPGNNQSLFAEEVFINLTQHPESSDFTYFNQVFDFLLLPEFKTEIKKINNNPKIKKSFDGLLSERIAEGNAIEWQSQKIIIHSFNETIKSETVKTWISLKVFIQRDENKGYVLHLFFAGGTKVIKKKNLEKMTYPYRIIVRLNLNGGPKLIARRKISR